MDYTQFGCTELVNKPGQENDFLKINGQIIKWQKAKRKIKMENSEIISIYTVQEAVNDGVLVFVGSFNNLPVVITAGLFSTITRDNLINFVETGLEHLKVHDCQDSEDYKFRVIDLKTWLIFDSQAYTFLRPEDY